MVHRVMMQDRGRVCVCVWGGGGYETKISVIASTHVAEGREIHLSWLTLSCQCCTVGVRRGTYFLILGCG